MPERTDIDVSDMTRLLAETSQLLSRVRPDESRPQETLDVRGEGISEDGHLAIVLNAHGRVEEIRLDRTVMRQGSEALADQVRQVLTLAQGDLRVKLAEIDESSMIAWNPEELLLMQRDATVRLGALVDGLTASMDKIARAAGTAEV